MQFSAIVNRLIVKPKLNSAFTNDLIRKYFFSKTVQSYRLCSFNNTFELLFLLVKLIVNNDRHIYYCHKVKHIPFDNTT